MWITRLHISRRTGFSFLAALQRALNSSSGMSKGIGWPSFFARSQSWIPAVDKRMRGFDLAQYPVRTASIAAESAVSNLWPGEDLIVLLTLAAKMGSLLGIVCNAGERLDLRSVDG